VLDREHESSGRIGCHAGEATHAASPGHESLQRRQVPCHSAKVHAFMPMIGNLFPPWPVSANANVAIESTHDP
jgi:hypothetical protein